MKKLPSQNAGETIHPIAQIIWEDIIYSMDRFTNDSPVPKFFMPEEISNECRSIAAIFATIHFSPMPSMKRVYRSRLYTLFYFSMMCGVQMYIQERGLFKGNVPYAVQTDKYAIKLAKNKIVKQLMDGVKVFSPIDEVLELFLKQLSPLKEKIERYTKDTHFDGNLFDTFLPAALVCGYLFAKEMILDKASFGD